MKKPFLIFFQTKFRSFSSKTSKFSNFIGFRLNYFCTILKKPFCVEAEKKKITRNNIFNWKPEERNGAVCVGKCTVGLTLGIVVCLLTVFPRKPRSEHCEIIPAGAKYQNKVHPYHALALVWTHLHASRVLWMLCRLVESKEIEILRLSVETDLVAGNNNMI